MRSEEHHELAARRADVGTIEDIAFEALVAAAAEADAARARSAAAQTNAAHARREAGGGATMLGAGVAAGLAALAVAVGFAIAHSWIVAGIAAILAGAILLVVGLRANGRSQSGRDAARLQQTADAALAEERAAASAVAAVLEPLGLASIDDLTRRRDRLRELEALARSQNRASDHLVAMRTRHADATRTFDTLALTLVPDATGSRGKLRDEAKVRAARRYELDGLDAARGMIELRRGEVLGGEDEFALERELNELLAEGVEPAVGEIGFSQRLFDQERAEIEVRLRATEASVAALGAERRAAEDHAADLAGLDEEHALARVEIAKIETFARSIALARTTLEARTREAHEKFARRLEDYAAEQFTTITGGRYTDLFVDPTTLDIRVRVPETRAIVGLETLSAGTREQAFLVVRFAMARMFSEGLETPPLLLDDPFAFWDAARVERCLPILLAGAQTMQAIVFTASEKLAEAARSAGAAVETLHRNADGDFVDALDRDENLLFPR
jgi:DNA repair exonuclease SbcCD ATPase subunit